MGDDDGEVTAIEVDRHEQKQQREAGDHLRHDQGRIDHGGEWQAAAEAESGQSHRCHGAEHGRKRRRDGGDAERGERRVGHGAIFDERRVPARRPAAPNRHEPRGIERIDHEYRDRRIEKSKPQYEREEIRDRQAPHWRPSISRACKCW